MTPQQTLIELRLGGDLTGFIAKRRAEGKGWRPIAAEISDMARTPVSHETVRQWFTGARASLTSRGAA